MGFRIYLGYCNFNFPLSLTLIDRTLGDFIDVSNHPTKLHSLSDEHGANLLHKDSIPKINLLESRVILPTFKFSSGWGTRKLSTKEIFGIWGLSELLPHELNAEEIIQLVPIQPLALSIRLFLDKLQPRHAKPLVASTKDLNLPN